MNKLDLYITNYSKRNYFLGVLIGFDQWVNSILGGYVDETISSRAHRCNDEKLWAVAEKVIDTLFFFDKQGNIKHCELSYYGELAGEHFPREGKRSE